MPQGDDERPATVGGPYSDRRKPRGRSELRPYKEIGAQAEPT